MKLNFKNRIAFYYMIATAVIMAVVFGAIYFVVHQTVLHNLDADLSHQAEVHTKEIRIVGDSLYFKNKTEWEEREHREIQVAPVFIQLIDKNGNLMDKSPNLKEDFLPFNEAEFGGHFDTKLKSRAIRQVQVPIKENGEIKGYILSAMSSESSNAVILRLRNVLLISYLIVLVGLYFISRILAGRSIKPVQDITNTITTITQSNLNERVDLPQNKDEIHDLSTSFNALLERIENAIEREKQFTTDASHELRTPLATLRGTLEVLIRKPREQKEYEEKITYSLGEIEKMTSTIEQLLLLARLDAKVLNDKKELIALPAVIDESLTRFRNQIAEKKLKIAFEIPEKQEFLVPSYYTDLIIDNIISNAVKYAFDASILKIKMETIDEHVVCHVEDEGIGIKEEDLSQIFENFYRSDALEHKLIKGNGLGLSIVKKSADAIHAKVEIISKLGKGTKVTITF